MAAKAVHLRISLPCNPLHAPKNPAMPKIAVTDIDLDPYLFDALFNGSPKEIEAALAAASPEKARAHARATSNYSGMNALLNALSKGASVANGGVIASDLEALEAVRLLAPLSDLSFVEPSLRKNALMLAFEQKKTLCAAFLAPLSDAAQRNAHGHSALAIALAKGARKGAVGIDAEMVKKAHAQALKCVVQGIEPTAEQWEEIARVAVENGDPELLEDASHHCGLGEIQVEEGLLHGGRGSEFGSLLFLAARGSSAEVIETLLRAGLNPEEGRPRNPQFTEGTTPLMHAVHESATRVADFSTSGQENEPRLACVRALARVSDPTARNVIGEGALSIAIEHSAAQSLKILLAHGHSPNTVDDDGFTALHLAVTLHAETAFEKTDRAEECIEALAEVSDLKRKNKAGETALDIAISSGDVHVIDILLGAMSPEQAHDAMAKVHAALFPRGARKLEARELEKSMSDERATIFYSARATAAERAGGSGEEKPKSKPKAKTRL